jgi:hypothetical protein
MATIVPAQQTAIANLYVALFNRAPDAAGFGFWVQSLSNGASLASITSAFLTAPEAKAIYPSSQTSEQFITSFYTTVFGRAPDAAGLAFWAGVVNANGGSSSDAAKAVAVSQIINVVSTPLTTKPADITDAQFAQTVADRATFTNKVTVGTYYAVDAKGTSIDTAKQVLSGVNATAASVDAAKVIADSATNVGSSFTGVVGADNFVGTGANDTFNFVVDSGTPANNTLSVLDKVAGGAGTDTLNVTVVASAGDLLGGADVSGIETIAIRGIAGSTATLAAPTGVTTVSVTGAGQTTVTGLAAGGKAVLGGVTDATKAQSFTYAPAATAGVLNVTGGNTAGATTLGGTGLTSATITGSNGINTLASLALGAAVTAITIDAQSALTTGNITGGAANAVITVKGVGAASIGTLATTVASVDASANTGGVTVALSAGTQKFVGGAGNDVVSTFALTTGTVDAGAGTADRLVVAATTDVDTALKAGKYTNFEIVQVAEGVAVDLDVFTGITGVRITDANGGTGAVVNNLTAAQAANVTIASGVNNVGNTNGAITLNVKGASTGGQIDTVKASVITAASNNVDLTGLVLTGVEKLELTGTGVTGTAGSITLTTVGATSLDSIIVKNAGAVSVTVDAAHTATNLSIDASGSTGAVTITAAAYAPTTGTIIKGGSGVNTLTGSAGNDVIIGGAGNDTIVGGGGADTITLGAGTNVFTFAAANFSGTTVTAKIAAADTITDFKAGTNSLDYGATALAAIAHATAAVSGTAAISANGLASFSSVDTTLALKLAAVVNAVGGDIAGTSVIFNDGADAYVFVTDGTATLGANDALIKLAGVAATTGLTFVGGDITAVV